MSDDPTHQALQQKDADEGKQINGGVHPSRQGAGEVLGEDSVLNDAGGADKAESHPGGDQVVRRWNLYYQPLHPLKRQHSRHRQPKRTHPHPVEAGGQPPHAEKTGHHSQGYQEKGVCSLFTTHARHILQPWAGPEALDGDESALGEHGQWRNAPEEGIFQDCRQSGPLPLE